MADIIDFINDTMVATKTVEVFQKGADETVEVAMDGVADATKDMLQPWASLVNDEGMVNAVLGDFRDTANITLTGTFGDAYGIYFLEEPVAADDVPQDWDIETPLPCEEMAADWHDDAPMHRFVDGDLKPVENVNESDQDVATAPAPESVEDETQLRGRASEDEFEGAKGGSGGDQSPTSNDVYECGEDIGDGAGSSGSQVDERTGTAEGVEPATGGDVADAGSNEPARINASLIIGKETPAFNEALNKDVEVLTGLMYGAHNRQNTQDGEWNPVKMPLIQLIQGFDKSGDAPEFGFSRHTASKNKAGPCIVLGSSIDKARKAKAMKTMSFLGIDIDSGARLAEVVKTIERKGIFCLVHTSYNHGKCGLQLKRDEVLRKLGIKEDPSIGQIQEYLRLHDKNRYEESFIQEVKIKTAKKQVKEGVVIELDTPPLDKMRLIFPLLEPVNIIEQGETHQDALDDWENAVTGLAHTVLGVHFDTSCTDPSRLFYTPRHPKDSDNWESYVIMGDPLDYSTIPRVKKAQYTKNRDLNAFVQADDSEGPAQIKTIFLPSGADLNVWHSKVGKNRLMLADLLEAYCADKIRQAGGEKSGHVHTECPFEHEHTTEGGTGTMAINCLDNSSEYWTWFCHHDACQGRHKTEILGEAINRGWFDEELLMSDEFLLPPEDNDVDEDAEEVRAQQASAPEKEPEGPPSIEALIDRIDFDGEGVEAAIRKLFKRLYKREIDKVEQTRINKIMKDKSGLDLNTLKSFWRDLDMEKYNKDRDDNAKTSPIITEADFDVMVEYAENRVAAANAENPRLFHYMERLAEVREDQNADAKIALLDRDGFAAFLNRVTRFQGKVTDKKMRHVAAPQEVVRHIYSSAYHSIPPLRGLVTSPTFSSTGRIIMEHGYHHESALYYQPNVSLVVPPVTPIPTEDEVFEAKRLLVEEVFADFPLGGHTRPDIVEEVLHGSDGIPAVAHLIAFALLPFCREMIDGPTPGHLVVKPTPGTGASLLTEVTSIISTGYVVPSMAMPTNKDEMGKTLTSVLANGQNIVFFDNISDKVDSAELASALTAKTYSARILGKSQTVETEVRCAWILTGNNVQLSGELVRRLIMIDLDAQMSNPEERSGFKHENLRGWVEKNRGLLVWACLTLVQNWVAKGMPNSGEGVQASYENWSRVMGGILAEAGILGFLGNRAELEKQSNSESSEDLISLFEFWWEKAGSASILVADPDGKTDTVQSIAATNGVDLPCKRVRNDDGEMLFSKQSLGTLLTKYKNRVFDLENGTSVLLSRGNRTRHGFPWSLTKTQRAVMKVGAAAEEAAEE